MPPKMTKAQLEKTNMDRAAAMAKTLMAIGRFPVLVGGIIPGPEGNQLTIFGFIGNTREDLREMLLDFLKHLDESSYVVPEGYGS